MSTDVPGLLATNLQSAADVAVRAALCDGRTMRREQGFLLRVAASPLSVH